MYWNKDYILVKYWFEQESTFGFKTEYEPLSHVNNWAREEALENT